MNLLTDREILALEKETPAMNDAGEEWIYFARAIEAAVIAKLATVSTGPSVSTGSPPSDMRYSYEYVERHAKECAAAARVADQREIEALKARVEHDFQRWQEAIANYDFERSLNEKLMDGSAKLTDANAKLRWVIESMKQEAETGRVIGDEIGMRDALEEISRQGLAAQNAMKETP